MLSFCDLTPTTNPATFGFLHFLEQFYTILSFFGAGYMENDSKYKYFFGKEPAGYFISETESCQFHVAFQRFGVKAGRGPLFIICMDIYMRCWKVQNSVKLFQKV